MTIDLALAENKTGAVEVHRADCPDVRLLADLGYPVLTMLGCESKSMPGLSLEQHDCLDTESER